MTATRNLPNPMEHVAISYLASAAPLVVGNLHVQDAVRILKTALTWQTTEQEDLPVEEAARKLERSERWMYKYRGLLKKFSSVKDELALHTAIGDYFFVNRQEQGGTLDECLNHLKGRGFTKRRLSLENLLDTYCREGYLSKSGELYRSQQSPQHIRTSVIIGRAARAAGLTGVFGALIKHYVESEEGYVRHLHVVIARDEYQAMVGEIKAFMDEAVKKAVVRSLEKDPEQDHPDSVTVDGLLLFGSAPYFSQRKG